MSDDRLPFPIHGTRMSGEGDLSVPLGDAGRLLYITNMIADLADVPVFGLKLNTPYGTVSSQVAGPLTFKRVRVDDPGEPSPDAPPEPKITARLVWLPEGFVLTPRSESAPDGYGMPPTENGLGTPGGPLKEVILNRFKDNQYPDALYRHAKTPAADSDNVTTFSGNLFFMDWELTDREFGLGVVVDFGGGAAKLYPQFSARWKPKFREPDGGKWYCHRPRHHPKESPFETAVRQETNLIREQVGAKALGKPLRGSTGELARDIAYQIRYASVIEHDSPEFREGHQTLAARSAGRAALFAGVGENLYLDTGGVPGKALAYSAADGWKNSPLHYANMVYDWTLGGKNYAWVDSAAGTWDKYSGSGAVAAQMLYTAHAWVVHGVGTHEEKAPITIPDARGEADMFLPMYPQHQVDDPATARTYIPEVGYRGRTIALSSSRVYWDKYRILGGTMVTDEMGVSTKMRIAALLRPDPHGGAACVVIYEGLAHDFKATQVELARYWLPFEKGSFISRVQWSASGKKAVFCYTEVEDAPRTTINGSTWQASEMLSGRPVVGQKIHFVEFGGADFTHLFENSLTIRPITFGIKQGADAPIYYHSQSCEGECELLAAYSGEDVVYATIKFLGTTNYATSGAYWNADYKYEKTIRGSLVFPNGDELVYTDLRTEKHMVGGQGRVCIVGFIRHLMPGFDIMDPQGVAYVQYDMPTPENKWLSMKLVICGETVKSCQDPLQRGEGMYYSNVGTGPYSVGEIPTLGAHRGLSVRSVAGVTFFTGMRDWMTSRVPAVPYKAVLVGYSHTTAPYPLPCGPDLSDHWEEDEYVLLGPTILTDGIFEYHGYEEGWFDDYGYRRVEKFRQCKYKGERLYAGRIEGTLGSVAPEYDMSTNRFTKYGAFPEEEDQYYWFCTFDLPAALNVPGLKDNILPIGVL